MILANISFMLVTDDSQMGRNQEKGDVDQPVKSTDTNHWLGRLVYWNIVLMRQDHFLQYT